MRLVKKTTSRPEAPVLPPWKILIVDDEPEVHTLTRLNLKRMLFSGRKLQLLSAASAQEAKELLHSEEDTAVALVDVVMDYCVALAPVQQWLVKIKQWSNA